MTYAFSFLCSALSDALRGGVRRRPRRRGERRSPYPAEKMRELKAMGVSLRIDAAGTACSNLSALKSSPLSLLLKIPLGHKPNQRADDRDQGRCCLFSRPVPSEQIAGPLAAGPAGVP